MKAIGSTAAVFAFGGVGTATARRGASASDSIVDIAVDSPDFDVLVAAVQEAGLVDALSGDNQLTVFAPTNAAFNDIGITNANVDSIPTATHVGILTYHVTPGRRYAKSVVGAPSLPTLKGERIDVDGTSLDGGQANIVATDIEASNGVIHVIDGVLMP